MAGNVIEAMRELTPDAVLLVAGSAAQYGMALPSPVDETFPTVAVAPQGAAKCVLEKACTEASLLGGLRLIWTRSFNHLGPGQGLDAPVANWVRQVALAERTGEGVLATGALDRTRDFLDARDVADAYLALVESGAEGVVNVCSGVALSLEGLVGELLRVSGASVRVERDLSLERATDPPYVVGDPGRLHSLVEWRPAIALETSLQDMLEEWRGRLAEAPLTPTGAAG
jgi:nucleoside-diphosphate-sugar epimerase